MNFKIKNKFFVKIPKDFLNKFWLEKNNLRNSIKDYIYNFYLQDKQKTFKSSLSNWEKIIFHKIQVNENNQSSKKAKRVLIFILLNNPEGINTIFPIFSFTTQEEKKYTTQYMKNKTFVKKLINDFWKYQKSVDINWNKINETLWIEL
jgi:hypothetical protein